MQIAAELFVETKQPKEHIYSNSTHEPLQLLALIAQAVPLLDWARLENTVRTHTPYGNLLVSRTGSKQWKIDIFSTQQDYAGRSLLRFATRYDKGPGTDMFVRVPLEYAQVFKKIWNSACLESIPLLCDRNEIA